ncbi:helix-turn-helix domain-containing protein [Streptomyces flaveolus]|uniref:helix-turn-helix domain-containing protein n=1 Tax=Streptomyces flaveolus TaxID=67297 RepID=UPI0036F9DB10
MGARDTTEFIALLRQLKARSGLTYRQLERRAADQGEVLARSTLADVLRRDALPRPELVVALVRACGAEDRTDAWLEARERIQRAARTNGPTRAMDGADGEATRPAEPGASGPPEPESSSAPAARRRRPWRFRRWTVAPTGMLLGSLTVVLLSGAWLLSREDSAGESAGRASDSSAGRPADTTGNPGKVSAEGGTVPTGWSTLRPARTPDLCVTEGRERNSELERPIAVQRPCTEATPPRTRIDEAGDGLHMVKWLHPVEGWGCLTVIHGGLLEPWEDCRPGRRPTQAFLIEPLGNEAYRLQVPGSDLCWGVRGDDRTTGAEIVQEPCTDGADQKFLIKDE